MILGWNKDQWDFAFEWYAERLDMPPLPSFTDMGHGLERHIAVQREWLKQALPLSGPKIVERAGWVAKLEVQRIILQTSVMYEKLHENETDRAKKACYLQFINSLDEMFRNL